jgi:hypothetical protein
MPYEINIIQSILQLWAAEHGNGKDNGLSGMAVQLPARYLDFGMLFVVF